jgi:DNA-binding transcriptional regulator YbjK
VELVAEHGVRGVTHRAVAARAGLPLSATNYFFASIDELVLEALRVFMAEFTERLDMLAAAMAAEHLAPAEAADRLSRALLAEPRSRIVAQFEAYLEVTRRPEPPSEVKDAIAALERLAHAALAAAGATRPADGARAFVAMTDGFALHRLAWPRPRSDRTALRDAFLALFIAYTMDGAERAGWDARLRQRPAAAA